MLMLIIMRMTIIMDMLMGNIMDILTVVMVIVMDNRESQQQRRELSTGPSYTRIGMMMKRKLTAGLPYGSMP